MARKTATEKKRKVDEKVDGIRKVAVDAFVKMLEESQLSWIRSWQQVFKTSGLPVNGSSRRLYNGCNIAYLWSSAYENGYRDPRWFTFKQAKELGYHPRKGEHGTGIEYCKKFTKMYDSEGNVTDNAEEAARIASFWRTAAVFWVFNVDQLADADGNPMPYEVGADIVTEQPKPNLVADRLIASSRCPVSEKFGAMRAFYSSGDDRISLPSRNQFSSPEAFVSVLAHEMIHSTYCEMGRALGKSKFSPEYAYEELVAEMGSTFVLLHLGIHRTESLEADENFTNHAAYLQSWLKHLHNDQDYLFKAVSDASRAANFVLDRYESCTAIAA